MHFELSTEQTMLVDTVRSFVEKELYPHEAEVERLDEVPAELARHLQGRAIELGLYAANMPEALGGGGLNNFCVTLEPERAIAAERRGGGGARKRAPNAAGKPCAWASQAASVRPPARASARVC